MNRALLDMRNLHVEFKTDEGVARAVHGVDLQIGPEETLGLVGESGSGKSVTALTIMRLIPQPPGKVVSGEILLEGRDLLNLSEREMRRIRGRDISMIFQEPMTSLNPVYRVGTQISDVIRLHQHVRHHEAMDRALQMLRKVGIADPERRVTEYPHQMSGGMRQRIMIAMALACNPKLMIADEPTTALDVTIQAQILDLMQALKEEMGTSILLITHDLGVIAEMAQRVAVMYAGTIMEYAAVNDLFAAPLHPYTQGLLNSIPKMDQRLSSGKMLHAIPGTVPSLLDLPAGCTFQDRCDFVFDRCRIEAPSLVGIGSGHFLRCWRYV